MFIGNPELGFSNLSNYLLGLPPPLNYFLPEKELVEVHPLKVFKRNRTFRELFSFSAE